MIHKTYTAQEMRDRAKGCEFNGDLITTAMLRQAADALEREEKQPKKYEYGVRTHTGEIYGQSEDIVEVCDEVAFVNADGPTICDLVRRPVGEWEEVK